MIHNGGTLVGAAVAGDNRVYKHLPGEGTNDITGRLRMVRV
jgi:hypothetical protein